MHRSPNRVDAAGVIRLLAAVALGTVSFIVLRGRYSCSINGEQLLVGIAFGVAFVSFIAQCWLLASGLHGRLAAAVGMAIGLLLYAVAGAIVYRSDPRPRFWQDESVRVTSSVVWPVGVLQRTGAYNEEGCGY